jgi:hypothetical protein
MANISTTGPSDGVQTPSSNDALGSLIGHSGRDEALSDELYSRLRQLRRGGTFVRERTKEAARKRLRAECGRDYVPCGRGYKIVDAVEQELAFRRDAK